MQKPALLDKARTAPAEGGFAKPDIAPFVPKGMEDAVERIVAAGMKMMYAPETRDTVKQAIQGDEPTPKKLADNVAGLILMLDQKTQGGLPVGAMFPAAVGLMGEAAELLVAAGQPVTQEDFNEAALQVFVTLSKKMGATDDEIMGAAAQAIGPGEAAADDPAAAEAMPPEQVPA